jgi:phosphodiesterase/alkaline phosphatase D-like protein
LKQPVPRPLSQADFDQYRQTQAGSKFTAWVRVPQELSPLTNPHNPDEQALIDKAQATDYSVHLRLALLRPSTPYHFRLWIKGEEADLVRAGQVHRFATAPEPSDLRDVSFIATTCFNHAVLKDLEEGVWPAQGFRMFRGLLERVKAGSLSFDFAILNGDTVYLDKQGAGYRSRPEHQPHGMRARYFDNYLLPLAREFFRQFSAYFLKDDHDWRFNDADPVFSAQTSPPRFYRQIGKYYRGPPGPLLGKKIFEEMHPVERGPQAAPYRTFRWGRGLQVWLLESRECRYPNGRELERYKLEGLSVPHEGRYDQYLYYPDYCGAPSVEEGWGQKQFSWLIESLKSSDAYFKVIVSPTPVLGPGQDIYPELSLRPVRRKADNHVRRFRQELARFLETLQRERLRNVYFVSGDRHFIWHSRYQTHDRRFTLHEFGSGPFADDIVALGNVFYRDEQGEAELVDSLRQAGFVHVQVTDVATDPKLRVEWYAMEDWKAASIRRWTHSFEAKRAP